MMRGKKAISLLLTLTLCLGMALQVQANEIDQTKQKAADLESQKKAAEQEKSSLAEQLNALVAEMEKTRTEIDKKEAEISQKEEELIQAQVEENGQYESMKKRIQYMYENGNTQFIEILCSSKNIGDFLNNAEYISTISEYDRNMLVEFQKVVKKVEEQKTALKTEYTKLETMQNELVQKQENVKALVESKSAEINSLQGQLSETTSKLSQLEEAAAAALRKQQEQAQTNSGGGGYSQGGSVVTGNGQFTHPCPAGYISSPFGYRDEPMAGAGNNHKGTDYAAPTGTPIYAADSGSVISAAYSGTAGNMVVIDHGNGLQTWYMHTSQMFVSAGQSVSKGQNIAAVGNTGNSTGPHLHFQVMLNGVAVNGANYL